MQNVSEPSMSRSRLKEMVLDHVHDLLLRRPDDYEVKHFDPGMMDISGGGQHLEMIVWKVDRTTGEKQCVASGSWQKLARQLGLVSELP
jgi:hypothetical protein